jgi:hypothetical protein
MDTPGRNFRLHDHLGSRNALVQKNANVCDAVATPYLNICKDGSFDPAEPIRMILLSVLHLRFT